MDRDIMECKPIAVIILASLMIGTMGFLIHGENGVEAVGSPIISIQLSQQKMTAYVAPGQDGIVTFTGTVSAQAPWSPSIQQLIVELEPDAGGWSCTAPPALLFHKGVTERDFSITVQVPQGTSHNVQGTLTIGGTWHYEPGATSGSVEPVTGLIYVAQYFDCDLNTNTPYIQAEKSGMAEFTVEVVNNGNGNDEMKVEVTNTGVLSSEGLTARMPDDTVNVPEGSSRELVVLISVGSTASIGGYGILLSVRSLLAEELGAIYEGDEIELDLEVVRELEEEPEEPEETEEPEQEETPVEPEAEPQEDLPEENDDGGSNEEDIEPTYTPGESETPSLGLFGTVFSAAVVLAYAARRRRG